jgi:hypothetical protein
MKDTAKIFNLFDGIATTKRFALVDNAFLKNRKLNSIIPEA